MNGAFPFVWSVGEIKKSIVTVWGAPALKVCIFCCLGSLTSGSLAPGFQYHSQFKMANSGPKPRSIVPHEAPNLPAGPPG